MSARMSLGGWGERASTVGGGSKIGGHGASSSSVLHGRSSSGDSPSESFSGSGRTSGSLAESGGGSASGSESKRATRRHSDSLDTNATRDTLVIMSGHRGSVAGPEVPEFTESPKVMAERKKSLLRADSFNVKDGSVEIQKSDLHRATHSSGRLRTSGRDGVAAKRESKPKVKTTLQRMNDLRGVLMNKLVSAADAADIVAKITDNEERQHAIMVFLTRLRDPNSEGGANLRTGAKLAPTEQKAMDAVLDVLQGAEVAGDARSTCRLALAQTTSLVPLVSTYAEQNRMMMNSRGANGSKRAEILRRIHQKSVLKISRLIDAARDQQSKAKEAAEVIETQYSTAKESMALINKLPLKCASMHSPTARCVWEQTRQALIAASNAVKLLDKMQTRTEEQVGCCCCVRSSRDSDGHLTAFAHHVFTPHCADLGHRCALDAGGWYPRQGQSQHASGCRSRRHRGRRCDGLRPSQRQVPR